LAFAQQQQGQFAPMSQSSQPTRLNQYSNNQQYPQQQQQYGQQQNQYGQQQQQQYGQNQNQFGTTSRFQQNQPFGFSSTTTMNPNQRFFNSAQSLQSLMALGVAAVALVL